MRALIPLLLATTLAAQTAPSYVEFSARFLGEGFNTVGTTRMEPSPDGGFYLSGVANSSQTSLAKFPIQPFRSEWAKGVKQLAYVARFSATGELLSWRLIAAALIPYAPRFLKVCPSGNVAVVTSAPTEPFTDGAWYADSGASASLLVLSPDLGAVVVSVGIAPPNTTITDFGIMADNSVVFTGASGPEFVNNGRPVNSLPSNLPYTAQVSADGKRLVRIKNVGASFLAFASDGGLWLASGTSNATHEVFGPLGRGYAGANLASWSPVDGKWTFTLQPELSTGQSLTVFGSPRRAGLIYASNVAQLFRTDDFGCNWTALPSFPGGALTPALADANRLYTLNGATLWKSSDGGASWTKLQLPDVAIPSEITVSADAADIVLLKANGLLYLSSDGGQTWRQQPDARFEFPGARFAVEGSHDPRVLLINTSGAIYTADGPVWKQLAKGPSRVVTGSFRYLPGPQPVIAEDYGSLTIDYGATWRDLPESSPSALRKLFVNPANSTEWWFIGDTVMHSLDAGQSWTSVRDGVGFPALSSIAFSGVGEQPIFATLPDAADVYLRHLTPDWAVDSASYWGGGGNDSVAALMVDSTGRLNLLATTTSSDYPVTSDALQSAADGSALALTRFSPGGEAVEYSTVWGGAAFAPTTVVRAHVVDNRLVWCGSTNGVSQPAVVDPPSAAPFVTWAFSGGFDTTSRAWIPTFLLGATETTIAHDCAPLGSDRVALAGQTRDAAFPYTTDRYATPESGSYSLFLSILRGQ